MASRVVKVNGVEVVSEGPDSLVVNVNINQCSFLYFLSDLVKSIGSIKPGGCGSVKPAGKVFLGEQKALGTAQIFLGIICFIFGIMLSLGSYFIEVSRGAPFWTGGLFIASGILSIISENRPTRRQIMFAMLMNLASVCTAIAGIIITAQSMYYLSFWYDCPEQRPYANTNSWDNDGYGNPYGYEYDSMKQCKRISSILAKLWLCIHILMIIICAFELGFTLYSVGYALCSKKPSEQEGEVVMNDSKLLVINEAVPPPYEEKSQMVIDV